MKLSEAMMLGSVTCRMIPNDWNSCALGSAANAVGIPRASEKNRGFCGMDQRCADGTTRNEKIKNQWLWLWDASAKYTRGDYPHIPCAALEAIWSRFDNLVCSGMMSLEQLVDYVRSIEPECGECNRFECVCVKVPADDGGCHTNQCAKGELR